MFKKILSWLGFGTANSKPQEPPIEGNNYLARRARYLKLLEMQKEKREKWGLSK